MSNLIYLLLLISVKHISASKYDDKRAEIIENELKLTLGANITLSDKEKIVNTCLMKHKFDEVDRGYNDPEQYPFSRHYFTYKDKIKDSKVYKIIKDMPKGGLLHIHDKAMMGPDYMLNITYLDHLYTCFEQQVMKLRFSLTTPNMTCNGRWRLMRDLRTAAKNVTKFDQHIRTYFTLVVDNPDVVYPTSTEAWSASRRYFTTVQVLTYRPVWEQYLYDSLKMLWEDNIMYVEFRTALQELYELDGSTHDSHVAAATFRKVINKFKKDYPDFVGAKIILAVGRKLPSLNNSIDLARYVKRNYPEMFAGFDLVGQEDLGYPLLKFAPELEPVRDLNFFFHAGETDWYGTDSDMNLVDALLLGAKRLGHAYALVKHPLLLAAARERGVALEVNVLSNAVLSLVRDLRNHPLSVLLALGAPLVLASDDPGAWEADALSDDFYVAFVAVASRVADLRLLKTLALNSLQYSALEGDDKDRAIQLFHNKWNVFINSFNCSLY